MKVPQNKKAPQAKSKPPKKIIKVTKSSKSISTSKVPSTGTTPKVTVRKRHTFTRVESERYVRIDSSWRYPKGLDNKSRTKLKGWKKHPHAGYRNPRSLRGLHPSGLKDQLVYRPEDLEDIDPQIYGIRIAKTVGNRKRLSIRDKADELGLIIFNPSRVEFVEEKLDLESIDEEIEGEETDSEPKNKRGSKSKKKVNKKEK